MFKDVATIGELPRGVGVSLEKFDWIPMERLLAVKHSDPEYRAEKLMPQFYSEAWALVHLLLFDDKTLVVPTYEYLSNVDLGFPEPEAFKQSFPFDKAGLDEAVKKLVRGELIRIKKITFRDPVEVDQAPISKMTVAQADTAMARLTFMLGRPPAVVDPLMLAALKESSSESPIVALSARIAAHVHDKAELNSVRTLAADETIGVQERIDLADALLADGGTAETGKMAFALLDGTVHAANPPIEAVMLWARAAGLEDVPAVKLIEVLEPASQRAPHNTQLLQWLAISNERIGAKPKARALYTRIILVSQFEKERAWAQRQADSERLQDDPPPPAASERPAQPPAKRTAKPPVKN